MTLRGRRHPRPPVALLGVLLGVVVAGCGSEKWSHEDKVAAAGTLEQVARDAVEAASELFVSDWGCEADFTTINSLIADEGNVFFCHVTFTDDNTLLPGDLRTKYFVEVQPDGCMKGEGNLLWFDFSPGRAANFGLNGDPPDAFSACARLDLPRDL